MITKKASIKRCKWVKDDPLLIDYHDNYWGKFYHKDKQYLSNKLLFKLLCLEILQAGLNWRTVLLKQKHIEQAFDDFDFEIIALYNKKVVNRLLDNKGIIRHKGKIEAIIHNAKMVQTLIKENGSLLKYLEKQIDTQHAKTNHNIADTISKDLKKYGFKFIGTITVLSLLQTIGFVNGHDDSCDFNN